MRDVNYGCLIRYLHTTGALMFFALVYLHTARGLYYGSYKAPRELLWIIGVTILVIMMATAFFGYTLPWGQMSFWGATVIFNLLSAVPVIGMSLVQWLQGGFTIGDATLHRFYALHYVLPFVIVGLIRSSCTCGRCTGLAPIGVLETPSPMPTSISGSQPAWSRAPAPTENLLRHTARAGPEDVAC